MISDKHTWAGVAIPPALPCLPLFHDNSGRVDRTLFVCLWLLGVWLYMLNIFIEKPSVWVRKPCVWFRYTSRSEVMSVIRQNVFCAFMAIRASVRYCRWLWFHVTTNKEPVRTRKEGQRQPCIVVLDNPYTMVYTYVYPASRYTCTRVPSVPALYPLPPSSRRLPCLLIIIIKKNTKKINKINYSWNWNY